MKKIFKFIGIGIIAASLTGCSQITTTESAQIENADYYVQEDSARYTQGRHNGESDSGYKGTKNTSSLVGF
ncbi:MAG: hypothetical protein K5829_14920 [Treponema sp.]|nr:hypothetical protein [Treponema sp.]